MCSSDEQPTKPLSHSGGILYERVKVEIDMLGRVLKPILRLHPGEPHSNGTRATLYCSPSRQPEGVAYNHVLSILFMTESTALSSDYMQYRKSDHGEV